MLASQSPSTNRVVARPFGEAAAGDEGVLSCNGGSGAKRGEFTRAGDERAGSGARGGEVPAFGDKGGEGCMGGSGATRGELGFDIAGDDMLCSDAVGNGRGGELVFDPGCRGDDKTCDDTRLGEVA